MSERFEYDPVTGVAEKTVIDETRNQFVITKVQDVEGVLDRAHDLRQTRATDAGIKKGLWHYATIPLVTQYELLTKYNLNIHNKNDMPAIIDVINRDYPKLKSTYKTHSLKPRRSTGKASSPKRGKSPSIILPT